MADEQPSSENRVERFRRALEEGMRRHEEFMRRNTYPASSEEIEEINLFFHTYWTYRNSELIDVPTFAHLSFTIGVEDWGHDVISWELPTELTARTIDGEQVQKSEHWKRFQTDWYKLRNECEERRVAKWAAEDELRKELAELREAAYLGNLLGEYWKAEEKAYDLLLTCLSPEQKQSFWYRRYFLVTAPDGERFKIENRYHANIIALDEGGQRYCGVCTDDGGLTPKSDSFLAQKFALENDPNRLLAVSNRVDEI